MACPIPSSEAQDPCVPQPPVEPQVRSTACKEWTDNAIESNTMRIVTLAPKASRRTGVMVFAATTQLVQMFPYGMGIIGELPIAGALHYCQPLFDPTSMPSQDAIRISLDAA